MAEASEAVIAHAARRQTFHTLDALRGIAAAVVLTRHAPAFFGVALFHGSALGVDLFFVMSGFVIAHAYEGRIQAGLSPWAFMKIRLIRLYPLYALGTLVGILVAGASLLSGVKSSASGFEWTASLLGVSASASAFILPTPPIPGSHGSLYPLNAVAWSLAFELTSNAFYVLTFHFWTNRNVLILAACSAIGVAYGSFAYGSADMGWNWETIPGGFARVMYAFPIGILVYRKFIARHKSSAVSFLIPIALALIAFAIRVPDTYRVPLDLVLIVFGFPILVYVAAATEPPRNLIRACSFLGVTSYAIYALHRPTLSLLNGLLQAAHVRTESYAPWIGLPFLLGFFFVCWLVDLHFDQPVRRAAQRILPGGRPCEAARQDASTYGSYTPTRMESRSRVVR